MDGYKLRNLPTYCCCFRDVCLFESDKSHIGLGGRNEDNVCLVIDQLEVSCCCLVSILTSAYYSGQEKQKWF